MRADPLERIIAALQARGCRPKRVRDGIWRAHSPLREEKKPSLGITDVGDKILMNDFGGGRTDDILGHLNLSMADLYREPAAPPVRSSGRGRRVAVYPYEDSNGNLLAAKSRLEPKGFRWRRPSDETRRRWREISGHTKAWADVVEDIGKARPGAWMPGRGGIDVSIYRLPDLVDHRRVVVVNGEKAADRLWSLGFAATCGPSGESHWTEAYTDDVWRCGAAEVVVLPDNDKTGHEAGLRIARACHGYRPARLERIGDSNQPWATWPHAELDDPEVAPMRAKVLSLDDVPHRGDVVDWLDAGHEAAELRRLLDGAPDLTAVDQDRLDRKRELNRRRQQRFRDRRLAERKKASRSAA